jgi:hypothetical protein
MRGLEGAAADVPHSCHFATSLGVVGAQILLEVAF